MIASCSCEKGDEKKEEKGRIFGRLRSLFVSSKVNLLPHGWV
jgi:hypothetical protein